jgi:tripartite-type tricarboxylate transporter receptor subunit TctC
MIKKIRFLLCFLLSGLSGLSVAAYPEKPIKMIVPYAAGGGADNTARAASEKLGESLGQPIIIENKPGAGGVIGRCCLRSLLLTGYTILWDASAYAVNPAAEKNAI